MTETFDPQNKAEFDKYASSYEFMHARNVALSGESPEYFATYKQKFLERLLAPVNEPAVLDFGCGIGNLTRLLVRSFSDVSGYDPSTESVSLAKKRARDATFYDDANAIPRDSFDAVVLANVLHHVPPEKRGVLMASIWPVVRPAGRVIIFEHNPYNPITRKVVRECEFDDNAVLLYPRESRSLLEGVGLRDIDLDYIVFFPRPLAVLRPIEPALAWLPLGAQYATWGAKAASVVGSERSSAPAQRKAAAPSCRVGSEVA